MFVGALFHWPLDQASLGQWIWFITLIGGGAPIVWDTFRGMLRKHFASDIVAIVIHPPTPDQGARRIWSDSHGRLWVTEWNAGNLAMYNPATNKWKEWRLPGNNPMPYAVYADKNDRVWLSDFGANAIVQDI